MVQVLDLCHVSSVQLYIEFICFNLQKKIIQISCQCLVRLPTLSLTSNTGLSPSLGVAHLHYSDVIMSVMALRLFTQPFIQAQIKENIKTPRHWPLCREFTGEFPAQRASNAENVSIWWRHHAIFESGGSVGEMADRLCARSMGSIVWSRAISAVSYCQQTICLKHLYFNPQKHHERPWHIQYHVCR